MNYRELLHTITQAIEEYQQSMTTLSGPPRANKKPKDYGKIRDFLFKKIF